LEARPSQKGSQRDFLLFQYPICAVIVQLPDGVNVIELPLPDAPQPDQDFTVHFWSTATA